MNSPQCKTRSGLVDFKANHNWRTGLLCYLMFVCGLAWVMFSCTTLNGGTAILQLERSVTERTGKWDETNTKPFEQNENQTLEHTHMDPLLEHSHTTPQTDQLNGENPYSSNLCQDDYLNDHSYESPESQPAVTECVRDGRGNKDCSTSQGEQLCHYLKKYSCFIYPSKQLNCSWTSHELPDSSIYSASVIVCKEKAIWSVDCVGDNIGEGTQSGAMVSCHGEVDIGAESMIFSVNVSTPNISCLYTTKFHFENIVVLSPPPNVTVQRIRGGDLLVQWGIPYSQWTASPACFEYELSINNQEKRRFKTRLNYTEPNADPSLAYQVKIRTQPSSVCHEVHQWSAWSSTIEVPAYTSTQFKPSVVICIALGIPMILLALLILLRPQRVSKLLFPPIPQPSKNIKLILEREYMFQYVPTPSSKYVDDITIVEEADEATVKDPVPSW